MLVRNIIKAQREFEDLGKAIEEMKAFQAYIEEFYSSARAEHIKKDDADYCLNNFVDRFIVSISDEIAKARERQRKMTVE